MQEAELKPRVKATAKGGNYEKSTQLAKGESKDV